MGRVCHKPVSLRLPERNGADGIPRRLEPVARWDCGGAALERTVHPRLRGACLFRPERGSRYLRGPEGKLPHANALYVVPNPGTLRFRCCTHQCFVISFWFKAGGGSTFEVRAGASPHHCTVDAPLAPPPPPPNCIGDFSSRCRRRPSPFPVHRRCCTADFGPDGPGGHAFSPDGLSWTFAGQAYDLWLPYADGSSTRVARRERPQVLTDSSGRPALLFTGVDPHSGGSWTQVQPINTE